MTTTLVHRTLLRECLLMVVASTCLVNQLEAVAFQYAPTAMSKSLAEHDAVLIAQVTASEMGKSTVEARSAIKGMTPRSIELPDTWRPRTENTYGPIRLEKGKTFLLMLRRDERGQYLLSKDFAAYGVVPVKSTADPLVRATIVLFELSRSDSARACRQILAEAWKNESDETKVNLLENFFYSTAPDDAIVPFLTEAMRVKEKRLEAAGLVGTTTIA